MRIRILATPLERDEGEYAYMGQLYLEGVPPYLEAFNMKLPGTSIMYALFMILFGQTMSAIHLGLLFVNAASTLLVFLLAKKMLDPPAALVSALSFALLSISPVLLGFAAHATHFVVLFALGGMFVLLHALETGKGIRILLSGILFGCAFLMKQPGVFFVVFGLSLVGIHGMKEQLAGKRIVQFCALLIGGFSIPLLLILAVVLLGGTFQNFWFWVFQYAFWYGTDTSFIHGMLKLSRMLLLFWHTLTPFCLLIAAGITLVLAGKIPIPTKNTMLFFGLFSLLALAPGLQFRSHYFILVLPACSLFIGGGFHIVQRVAEGSRGWKYIPALMVVMAAGQNLYANKAYYFTPTPVDIVRQYYGINYFAESIPVSNFLREHTAPGERIAVIGSEPQIFFYTHRRSVSGHIYMYSMMEPQPYARRIQEEFIASVERARPNYLVLFWLSPSWGDDAASDNRIFVWNKKYTDKYYHPVGIIDFVTESDIRYIWGSAAREYKPLSSENIILYERNKAAGQ